MFDTKKKRIRDLSYENVDLYRCKVAFMDAIESMYYDDTITRSQFLELYKRYFDKLEKLRKEGA